MMGRIVKKSMIFLFGTALFALSGCQTILTKEFRHSGGYVGYQLDKRTFDASESKKLQLLRANMIMAMAARLGADTVQNGEDATAFAQYLQATANEINYTAANIYKIGVKEPCTISEGSRSPNPECNGYYVNFEADLPLVNARMLRLVLAALPSEHASDFLDDAASGDVLGAAFNALRVAGDSAESVHRVAAVYRSTLEIVASGQKTDKTESRRINNIPYDCAILGETELQNEYVEKVSTVADAAKCLGHTELIWVPNPNELKKRDINPDVKEGAFHALMRIAKTSCISLPLSNSNELATIITAREETCESVKFEPKKRPETRMPGTTA